MYLLVKNNKNTYLTNLKNKRLLLFAIIGLFSVIPFLILMLYVHPVGIHDWDWSVLNNEIVTPGFSFWDSQLFFYKNVMGRYSSTFVSSLTPFWFSIVNFKVVLLIILLLFMLSLFFWIYELFKGFVSTLRITSIFFGFIILYLVQLTGVFEAFYTLSSVLTYNLGAISFFIFLGIFIRVYRIKKKPNLLQFFLLIIMGIFTVGTNEMSLISINLFLVFIVFGNWYYRKKLDKSFFGLLFIVLLFSSIAILAPGNYIRMGVIDSSNDLFLTLKLVIGTTFFNWFRWISSTPMVILSLLYIPIGIRIAKSKTEQSMFKYPLFSLIYTLVLQPISLFILFWSSGNDAFPERVMDLIFLLTLPSLLYFYQSIISFIIDKIEPLFMFKYYYVLEFGLSIYLVFFIFFSGLNIDKTHPSSKMKSYLSVIYVQSNIGNAWLEILNGNAKLFDEQVQESYLQIKNCKENICKIKPPTIFPKFIYEPVFDRKNKNGEEFMGIYLLGRKVKVIYE